MKAESGSSTSESVRRLFEEEPAASRRSPAAGSVSLIIHAVVIGSVVAATYREFVPHVKRPVAPMRYVRVSTVPPPVFDALVLPRRVEPKVEVPRVATPALRAPEPVAPQPSPAPVPPVAPAAEPVVARAPEPVVQPAPVELKPVQPAGFDAVAAAPEADTRARPTSTGLFEAATAESRTATRAAAVTGAGFDAPAASAGAAAAKRQVASTGFDTAGTASAAPAVRQVAATEFADVRPVPAPARQAPAKPGPVTPVEVLFKPVPRYTEAARAQGVEGAVVLEVEFAASGTVRVLRVVKSLGHGLDEMASQAAAQIKFKPALESGRPVDHRASIQIVFRLT